MNWQDLIPKKLLTQWLGKIAHCKKTKLKNFLIRLFIRHYAINLEEIETRDLNAYKSFNAFFVRGLKENARVIDPSIHHLISPVDGTTINQGEILDGKLLQIKNHFYSLNALLANQTTLTGIYKNGHFLTVYLAPHNYHRVHAPYDCQLKKMIFVPGSFYSVNQKSVNQVAGLFAKNERMILELHTRFGPILLILVGAMLVGSMETVWQGMVKEKNIKSFDYHERAILFKKGEEMARFQYGSTIILLSPPETLQWLDFLKPGQPVQMGQAIAKIKNL